MFAQNLIHYYSQRARPLFTKKARTFQRYENIISCC